LNKARTEAQLVEGRKTGYGFGWKISDAAGLTFEHGGRISGFCSHVLRAPKVDLYFAIPTHRMQNLIVWFTQSQNWHLLSQSNLNSCGGVDGPAVGDPTPRNLGPADAFSAA
jgi:hypothetical protein